MTLPEAWAKLRGAMGWDRHRFGRALAAALCLLATASSPAADTGDWREFRSDADRFAVLLPGPPVHTVSSRLTAVGRLRSDEFRSMWGEAEFRVEVHEVPVVARWLMSDASLLERAAGDLLEDEEARDVRIDDDADGDPPERRAAYRVPDGRAGEVRLVLVRERLYILAALWPLAAAEGEGRRRFFSSFEVW